MGENSNRCSLGKVKFPLCSFQVLKTHNGDHESKGTSTLVNFPVTVLNLSGENTLLVSREILGHVESTGK